MIQPDLVRFSRLRWGLRFLAAAGSIGLLALGMCIAFPPYALPAFDAIRQAGGTIQLLDRHGERLAVREDSMGAIRGAWASYDQMAPVLREVLRESEDRRFDWHPGVDPLSAARALLRSVEGGRRGASTITMQLAGLLHPELGIGGGAAPWL